MVSLSTNMAELCLYNEVLTMNKKHIKLIPVPKTANVSGDEFPLRLCVKTDIVEWNSIIEIAKTAFSKIFDETLTEEDGGITFVCDDSIGNAEYKLIADGEITIFASTYEGCAYGLATVLQLSTKNEHGIFFPGIVLADKADRDYRGLMIDVARFFHKKEAILSYIDICFFFKIKYLHLHFNDDERFTLPSDVFPKLPVKGKSYTKDDIAEMCEYAKSRGVVLIPEIEIPGHSKHIVKNYGEIFADTLEQGFVEQLKNGKLVENADAAVSYRWESIICAGSESCYNGLITMIDELMELFPDAPYIHLGGDEACIQLWDSCSVCREYMDKHNIKCAEELYVELLARVTNYVISKGRTPILWEGFPREYNHLLSKKVIVSCWETHYQLPHDLLKDGFKIINCAWKPLYIVPYPNRHHLWGVKEILGWNIYNWQHWLPLSEATLNPINISPSDVVIGAQVCAWEMPYQYALPFVVDNLAAMSERVWSLRRYVDDEEFLKKLAPLALKVYALID